MTWFNEIPSLRPVDAADAKMIEEFLDDMRDNVVPQIEEEVFQRERRWSEAVRKYAG
ncbi:hypothetical protein [Paraburkholderia sp. J8-2]|uniref:hypothetical protein n=1 Tax=Paraburkholderia sp. J8-2 TaxID=2805440 RepID=UPI002AB70880|nr:hypothetical protein [Paraburkholderia sp. J8-2]